MANFKITNPQVIGKLKLSAESASKALQINASGELESSAVSTTELGYLSGVTSAIQTQLGNKEASITATSAADYYRGDKTFQPLDKAAVGLSNVPNVDATARANHTGSQLASTISDFSSAAKSATVADAIANSVTDIAPSQNAVFDALALKADASALSSYIPLSQKGANSGVATLDAGGKVPASQLPSTVMDFKGVFDPASATFTDATSNAGDVYLASTAGSYDAGAGSITYAIGDWAVHNGSEFQKSLNSNAVVSVNSQTGVVVLTKSDVGLGNVDNTSDATKNSASATLTNKTLTSPVINSPTGIVKADVGLSNVDNTSDANKPVSSAQQSALDLKANLASPTFTGTVSGISKTMVGLGNVDNTSDADKPVSTAQQTALDLKANLASPTFTGTVSGISKSMVGLGNVDNVQQIPMSYLDIDDTLAADSDTKVPSQQAVKAYVANQIGASAHAGDIAHASFSAANNQVAAASVTGLAFAAGSIRSFKAQVSVSIDATTDLNEVFELTGIQLASGFVMASSSVGDDSGVVFTITSAGQIQYTSQNAAGFTSNTIKFRANVTDV